MKGHKACYERKGWELVHECSHSVYFRRRIPGYNTSVIFSVDQVDFPAHTSNPLTQEYRIMDVFIRRLRSSLLQNRVTSLHSRLFFHRAVATTNPFHLSFKRRGYVPLLSPVKAYPNSIRTLTSTPPSSPPTYVSSTEKSQPQDLPDQTPCYQLTFTCKPCKHRSTHEISQHGYQKGTVLVTCPNCKNRHVISDHLKIFSDKSTTIEEILKQKGELVKRGRTFENGDVEFWNDKGE